MDTCGGLRGKRESALFKQNAVWKGFGKPPEIQEPDNRLPGSYLFTKGKTSRKGVAYM